MATRPSNPRKRRPQGGKVLDPEFRHQRAVKANEAAQSLDRYIATIVDRAPELTAEQRAKLAVLLQVPAGATSDAAESAA